MAAVHSDSDPAEQVVRENDRAVCGADDAVCVVDIAPHLSSHK